MGTHQHQFDGTEFPLRLADWDSRCFASPAASSTRHGLHSSSVRPCHARAVCLHFPLCCATNPQTLSITSLTLAITACQRSSASTQGTSGQSSCEHTGCELCSISTSACPSGWAALCVCFPVAKLPVPLQSLGEQSVTKGGTCCRWHCWEPGFPPCHALIAGGTVTLVW